MSQIESKYNYYSLHRNKQVESIWILDSLIATQRSCSSTCQYPRGVTRISVWSGGTAQVEHRRRWGRWTVGNTPSPNCPPPHWAVLPSQNIIFEFYIKMVSCHAFCIAISYRLAAWFTRIWSRPTCGIEIGDRSSIVIISSGKLRAKSDKNAPKTTKNARRRKLFGFCSFSYLFPQNFWGWRIGV